MKYIRALLRFIVFITFTLVLYLVWMAGSILIPNRQYWRQLAFETWAKSFVMISGMQIEVIGPVPQPPFFLVANHLSYTDVAALRAVVNGVFVAKAEIAGWFLGGRIVKDMGNIFIDRKNRRDIPRAGDEIVERLDGGEGVIVFPEGTSTKGDEVLPFNSSFMHFAARLDLPVSYASIGYRTDGAGPTPSEIVCWWDDITFLAHLFRLLTLKRYVAILNFGERPVKNSDRKRLAAELHDKVSEKFVPVL